jgi:hypothetical protein
MNDELNDTAAAAGTAPFLNSNYRHLIKSAFSQCFSEEAKPILDVVLY